MFATSRSFFLHTSSFVFLSECNVHNSVTGSANCSSVVRPVKIDGGVGKGKMLLWEDIGKKWNSSVASSLYLNSIQPALRRAYPRKRQYLLLEDNDPTG